MKESKFLLILGGICFSFLWASASAATKIGLQSAQPFVLAVTRFFIAGCILLTMAHLILKKRLPARHEWKQLAIYGFFNISVYLGLYVIAMEQVSAGLGTLAVATNPVFINVMGAIWLRQKITAATLLSLLLCATGVVIAAYPLLIHSYATPFGLVLLVVSMVAYSFGTLYFSKRNWSDLHVLAINGWQTIIGGAFLLPFLFFFYDGSKNHLDLHSIGSIFWLAIPVSIGAVQLWLFLLRRNPVKASFWLFLCPVFGFALAALLMKEPISMHTLVGVVFVVIGLYMVIKNKQT